MAPATEFQQQLLEAMEAAGMNKYRLARLLDPENPERAERNLYRWLDEENPTTPSLASLEAIARALGLPPDFFVGQKNVDLVLARLMTEVGRGMIRRAKEMVA